MDKLIYHIIFRHIKRYVFLSHIMQKSAYSKKYIIILINDKGDLLWKQAQR